MSDIQPKERPSFGEFILAITLVAFACIGLCYCIAQFLSSNSDSSSNPALTTVYYNNSDATTTVAMCMNNIPNEQFLKLWCSQPGHTCTEEFSLKKPLAALP